LTLPDVVLALILGAVPGPPRLDQASDQGVAAAVGGLQRRYQSVRTISGKFTQIYRAPGVEQIESGILSMKKPGLMRWEYREPEVKLFVADGRSTYLYTPEDRQVLVRPLSDADLRSTPLQFLLGQGDVSKSFSASWEKEVTPRIEGTLVLRLTPQTTQPDYAFLVLELDQLTFELRRLVIRELTANTSEFILTDLATNVKLEDGQFKFKIPKGVEVVHVEDK
jgi:outer membrane lipoprotein carrier protein